MFEKIKQVKERCDIASYRTKKKVQIAAAGTGVAAAVAAPASVLASGDDATASNILGSIIGIVLGIARYIGLALLAYGVFQMVMALKDDNADSKSRAMQLIVVSIVLIILKTIVDKIPILGNYSNNEQSNGTYTKFGSNG